MAVIILRAKWLIVVLVLTLNTVRTEGDIWNQVVVFTSTLTDTDYVTIIVSSPAVEVQQLAVTSTEGSSLSKSSPTTPSPSPFHTTNPPQPISSLALPNEQHNYKATPTSYPVLKSPAM